MLDRVGACLLAGLGPDPAADARVRPFLYVGGALVSLVELDAFPGETYGVNAQSAPLGY